MAHVQAQRQPGIALEASWQLRNAVNYGSTRGVQAQSGPLDISTHNLVTSMIAPPNGPFSYHGLPFIPISAILAKIKCSICSDQFDR